MGRAKRWHSHRTMDAEHSAWLERRIEQPIDPERVICDPHHHLWDYPGHRYALEELRADTGSGHLVTRTVFVECLSAYRRDGPESLRPVGETEFVAAMAAESERTAEQGTVIAGIVGHADLRSSDVADVLAGHVEAGGGRFRGIRHASAWDPSPELGAAHSQPPAGLLADPSFRSGIAVLARAGLSFDAWLYHSQLDELTDLARAQPEASVILNHLGGPVGIGPYAGRRREVLDRWRDAMTQLARCDNVSLKLGGIGMPIYGLGWEQRSEPRVARAGRCVGLRDQMVHRTVRCRAVHVRVELPGRQGIVLVHRPLERVQTDRRRRQPR
jgi:L-fuconolactonase